MANAKIYDSDGEVLNVDYDPENINKLRIGTDWYEKGALTVDGKLIVFDDMQEGWARQVGDFTTPGYEFYPQANRTEEFYPHSFSYAKERGEEERYINIYAQNVDCRDAIDNAIADSYDPVFGKLSSNAVAPVVKKFGPEEVAYVLALTVAENRTDDGRLSMDNRFWSVGCNSCFRDADYQKGFDIILQSGSPALNKFISQFRKETNFDPTMEIIGTDKEPFPKNDVYIHSYNYALKNNETQQYLWSWGLNCRCAQALDALIADPLADNLSEIQQDFGEGRVNFVLASTVDLYANNPAITDSSLKWAADISLPEHASTMERDGYLMRANADSLSEFLNENMPNLTNDRQSLTEISMAESNLLFNSPPAGEFTYGLYQISNPDSPYSGKKSAEIDNFHPDPADYTLAYSENMNGPFYNQHDMAEDIFEKFDPTNIDYPNDYMGRKASISDVIVINDGYHYVNAFYADDFGFRDLPDFVTERRDMFLPPEKSRADNEDNIPIEQQKEDARQDYPTIPAGR